MSEDIGFAVVGLGYGGTRCELIERTPGVRLAAVVDRNEARAAEFGAAYGVPWFRSHEEVLSRADVDVVGVYTPSGLHREICLDIASAHKHLLVTKPIEVTLHRADEIIAACADASVELFGEFYLRYYEDNWRLKRAVMASRLGRLILGEFGFKCFRPDDYYASDGAWRQTRELNGGGVVMNQGLHAIDLLVWLMGDVRSVQALSETYAHEIPVEDTAAAVLTMSSGATGVFVTTTTFRTTSGADDTYGGGYTVRAELHGDRGSVSLHDNEIVMESMADGPLGEAGPRPTNVFEDIAHALRTGDMSSPTLGRAADSRRVVEVAAAIYDSASSGRAIQLRPAIEATSRAVRNGRAIQ